jgi:hypothetical protein
MPSNVSLEVAGGPFVEVPWKTGRTTQDALEAKREFHGKVAGPKK